MASLNDIASKITTKIEGTYMNGYLGFVSSGVGLFPGSSNELNFISESGGRFFFNYRSLNDKPINRFSFCDGTKSDSIFADVDFGVVNASKVYNAVWNDYAEFYPRGEQTESGDIIQLDTLSKEEKYIKAKKGSTTVVGVHSDTFGHLIGGENPEDGKDYVEHNLDKYIPVGLVGRVNCKILGKIKKGDRVVVSDINGVGRKFNPSTDTPFQIFGMAVEDKDTDTIEKVKINFRGGILKPTKKEVIIRG